VIENKKLRSDNEIELKEDFKAASESVADFI
jgi:hypothetical protein